MGKVADVSTALRVSSKGNARLSCQPDFCPSAMTVGRQTPDRRDFPKYKDWVGMQAISCKPRRLWGSAIVTLSIVWPN
jgi:hypothetical protein